MGFEPTCRLRDNTLSRRARYDHFGTSPQKGVGPYRIAYCPTLGNLVPEIAATNGPYPIAQQTRWPELTGPASLNAGAAASFDDVIVWSLP